MHISTSPSKVLVLVIQLLPTVTALVTLQTIRSLTNVTDECRERIVNGIEGAVGGVVGSEMAGGLTGSQLPLVGGDEDGDEVEDTVAASLRLLCSDLLVELEKPLDFTSQLPIAESECKNVTEEYHSFIAATVKFLFEIQERQMKWRWSGESAVADGVTWMQGLWASRRTNSQDRSFIEQQMSLYSSTGCFGKSKEVLRRDVEVVEYLNDLIDSFD